MTSSIPRSPEPGEPSAHTGSAPTFPEKLAFARPSVAGIEGILENIRRTLESGQLTNGLLVREFERVTARYLGVRHCVAVSSCTAGLMLVLRASDLSGDVIVPSFTFTATAHAVAWNGLRPVFADIHPRNLTLSAGTAEAALSTRTSAILATHTYGTPADVEGLQDLARRHGIRLFFDAAHAFGSRRKGVPIGGFGDAEVFSLSPTKVLVAGEGGLIATNDGDLAERCRIGRDYGNPGNYDTQFVGLNARMSELHAAVALSSFQGLEERIDRRNALVTMYKRALREIPGLTFPDVGAEDRSTYKDFTILVHPEEFGLDAADLGAALADDGIDTRRYYTPPVHEQTAYRALAGTTGRLPATDFVGERVLTLPLWSDMPDDIPGRVAATIARIRDREAEGAEKIHQLAYSTDPVRPVE